MNNLNMPLMTQMVVDGNGETEICSIFFTRSESCVSVGAMIDIFQSLNPRWGNTKVILGDKDFADRAIYATKFPNAVLQICLFHVLVAFNREITPAKRDITVVDLLYIWMKSNQKNAKCCRRWRLLHGLQTFRSIFSCVHCKKFLYDIQKTWFRVWRYSIIERVVIIKGLGLVFTNFTTKKLTCWEFFFFLDRWWLL